ALIALLATPAESGRPAWLAEALEAARGADSQGGRARLLVKVAAALAGAPRAAVAREALAGARGIPEAARQFGLFGIDTRFQALRAVVPMLPPPERDALVHELFEAARVLEHDRWRTLALRDLAPYLDESRRGVLLQDARRTALRSDDGLARVEAL